MNIDKHLKYIMYQREYYHNNKDIIKKKATMQLLNKDYYNKHLKYHRDYYHKRKYNVDNIPNTMTKINYNIVVRFN